MQNQTKKNRKKAWIVALAAVVFLCGVCGAYLLTYYPAQEDAAVEALLSDGDVSVQTQGNVTAFIPREPQAGLIFYPGGKVETAAYAPLLSACAKENILCILVEMPCNLAIFDTDAAQGLMESYPEVARWYIGGHSLGGTCAGLYLKDHADEFDGLILLASYVTCDLSDTDLAVLSIYGSEDRVMNAENYAENTANLPDAFDEHVIDGGNHAGFGLYGAQKGDGEAVISPQAQIGQTARTIADFVNAI